MMQDQAPIRWPAPAKLNLFLHVNGRRPDGYHELQTLFIFLNHGDWLEFEPIPGSDQLTLSPAIPGVPDEQNLIIRAARLLQSRLASPQGAHIRLEKVLPMGGGIGGGSSDAATTLVALNHLWQACLCEDELAEVGVRPGYSRVGGGSFPEQDLPTTRVSVMPAGMDVDALRQGLLATDIPVIGRVEEGRFCLDPRTLLDEEFGLVAQAMLAVLSGGAQ